MQTRRSSLPLQLVALESRETPAGIVTASLVGGVLTLTGDDNDNQITSFTIVGGASPSVSITPDAGTTVDDLSVAGPGTAGTVVTIPGVVKSIRANFAGGNDTFVIDGTADFAVSGTVSIDLGDGDNALGLQTAGKLAAASLTVTGGDGLDTFDIAGGTLASNTITGDVTINMGLGKGDQNDPLANISRTTVSRLNVLGVNGLKLTALEGDEQVRLIDTQIKNTFKGDGGIGIFDVATQGGTIGSIALNSVGIQPANPQWGTSFALNGTTVARAVTLSSQSGVNFDFNEGTTGAVTLTAGASGFVTSTIRGVATINGNFLAKALRPSMRVQEGAKLTVNGSLSISGVAAVDFNMADADVSARGFAMTSTDGDANFQLDDFNEAIPESFTVIGAMNIKGESAAYIQNGGTASILSQLAVTAVTEDAVFSSNASSAYFNAPGAKTTIVNGALSVVGPNAMATQSESELVTSTGILVQGQKLASFTSYPNPQTEDPLNPGTFSTAAGAKTFVLKGGITIKSTRTVSYSQTEGISQFPSGVYLISQLGSADVRLDVGDGFNSVGPKMFVSGSVVSATGSSASYIQEGGDVSIAKGMKIAGTDGAQFVTIPGETKDENYNFSDLPASTKFTAGTLQVTGGAGDAQFRADGGELVVSGDLTISGKQYNRIHFGGTTGTTINGNLSVVGAQGESDSFVADTHLTVEKNTLINLGSGTNAITLGSDTGSVLLKGTLIVQTGDGADQIVMKSVNVVGKTTITTGAGADLLSIIGNSTFLGVTLIDTGGGDDRIEIANATGATDPVTFAAKTTIKAGAGNDTLTLGKAVSAGGDSKTRVVFGTVGSAITGDLNLNRFDDELSQFDPTNLTITGFIDPTP